MHNNFVLFRNLSPLKADDGEFGILFLTNHLPTESQPNDFSEALWLYGDSSLYARFLAYWQSLSDPRSPDIVSQSHTFSNLHDHLAWFFPDAHAANAATTILDELSTGLAETRQPTKIRLVLTGIDACHVDFARKLKEMQEMNDIDLQVVLPQNAQVAWEIVQLWEDMPLLRFFPSKDSSQKLGLQSRFMLIDGPYATGDNSPAEPRRLCFFWGEDFDLQGLQENRATWLRVADRNLFEEAERHFAKIWNASSDTLSSAASFGRQRCGQ